MKPLLEVQNLTVRYGALTIVNGASFALQAGDWCMLIGPNGAGKSTTVGAISQTVPYTGSVLFEGSDVRAMRPAERAQKIGVLMQNHAVGVSFTVEEVVRLGRYAYRSRVLSDAADSEEMVEHALEITGMKPLRNHSVLTLSGGELQRTFLAQAIAQNPRVLLLDEPTNHLDLKYQKEIFTLIRDWLTVPGRAVLSVVHDLNLVRAYGSRAVLMDRGTVAADGPIDDVLRPEKLNPVYGMDVAAWMREMLAGWNPV